MVRTSWPTRIGICASLAALIGCGGSVKKPTLGPLVSTNPPNQAASEGSVTVLADPGFTNTYLAKINAYRSQAYGGLVAPIAYSPVLYTAALRHAGYLDSINSEEGVSGSPKTNLTLSSDYFDLINEPVETKLPPASGNNGQPQPAWPAFFTNNNLRKRVTAVVGGRQLLDSYRSVTLSEDYLVAGGAPLVDPEAEGDDVPLSNFRGVSIDRYGFSGYADADNLWNHPFARLNLMRASTTYFGVGLVTDARAQNKGRIPPYPLFDNQFGGVAMTMEARWPVTVVGESVWPPDGGEVWPWGLDGVQVDPNDADETIPDLDPYYSGPIISITLPGSGPISQTEVEIDRVRTYGSRETLSEIVVDAQGRPQTAAVAWVYMASGYFVPQQIAGSFNIRSGIELFYGFKGRTGGGGDGQALTSILENGDILYIDQDANGLPGQPRLETGWDYTLFEGIDGDRNRFSFWSGSTILRFGPSVNLANLDIRVGDTVRIPPYDDPHRAGIDTAGPNTTTSQILGLLSNNRLLLSLITRGQDEITDYSDNPSEGPTYAREGSPAKASIEGYRPADENVVGSSYMRQNEILIIPSDPLVGGAWYRCKVRCYQASTGAFNREWWFKVKEVQQPPVGD
jgi:hypothetical protein